MLDSIVLRFRDFDVDTIAEHRQVIAEAGYVWWGWWRKNTEPTRREELEDIQELARAKPVEIGLFDRSTDRFFSARITDCVTERERGPSPEPSKTPKYYSDKSTIAAWFKITNIDELNRDPFTEKFGEVPIGDFTFFPIRDFRVVPTRRGRTVSASGVGPAQGSMPDVLFSEMGRMIDTPPVLIDAPPQKSIPDSPRTDTIDARSDYLLHISDLHFGSDHGFPRKRGVGEETLINRLSEDVRDLCDGQLGVIVISGDLTSKADTDSLIGEAAKFLEVLSTELRVPREAIFVVPGNHDFKLHEYEPTDYSHERLFHMMLESFHGESYLNKRIHRIRMPCGREIELLLINSVRLRRRDQSNYGYVDWSLYEKELKAVGFDQAVIRIAVLHHHLISMLREESVDEESPQASISTTLDAGAVIEGLQAHGFRVALHGHQHVPGSIRISRGVVANSKIDLADYKRDLVALGAGSAGAKVQRLSNSLRDNSYNLLKFEKDRITVHVRRFNPGMPAQNYFSATIDL